MLEGVKVLNFTHYLQGPMTAQLLTDLGAEVVKIEPPGGAVERNWSSIGSYVNGVGTFFIMSNRNMKSLCVDLKKEDGKKILHRLVTRYDVVLENFRPGVMDRLGLSYEALRKINPQLIYCSCSGYGPTGPYKDLPGQDLLAQSMTGLVDMTGNGDAPPMPAGTTVVDMHGAALAALGIVSAVYHREKTGKGLKVDSSLLNAALNLQAEALGHYLNRKDKLAPKRLSTGLASRVHSSPYGVYKTADGYIAWTKTTLEHLKELCEPGVFNGYTESDRVEKREEFDAVFAEQVKKKTTAYWMDELAKKGIWSAHIETYADVEKNPQVLHNKSIVTFTHPTAGDLRVIGNPLLFNGEAPVSDSFIPELGEHNYELLAEIGYTKKDIAQLKAEEVIFFEHE